MSKSLIYVLSVLLSASFVCSNSVSQNVESPPLEPSTDHTHPRMDFKHHWHLDLPSKLMSQGQFGTCLVHFQVDPGGEIRVAQVVRSTGFSGLDQACVQNILHQTLIPATDHGVATTEWVTWPISMNAKTRLSNELKDTAGVPQIQRFFALKTNLADYPAIAREVHQYKDCRIRLWVGPDATAEKLEVVQSTGIEMLDAACRAAVLSAPFIAAKQDGAAVGAWAEITMRWKSL
jgi:TonB family protein